MSITLDKVKSDILGRIKVREERLEVLSAESEKMKKSFATLSDEINAIIAENIIDRRALEIAISIMGDPNE